MALAVCQLPEFQAQIAKDTLTVVDFSATWCGPCRFVAPTFESLKGRYPEMTFVKIDIDDCPDVAEEYNITAVPTFKVFRGGKLLDSYTGGVPTALEEMVGRHAAKPTVVRTSSSSSRQSHPTRKSSESGKCSCGKEH